MLAMISMILEVLQNVGCSVPNGIDAVKVEAKFVSSRPGGHRAVREIIDMILEEKDDKII